MHTTHTTGPGSLLKALLRHTTPDDLGTFAKMHGTDDGTAPQARPAGGLFAPMFTKTAIDQRIAKAAPQMLRGPQPQAVPAAAIAARQPVAVDPHDTAATHHEHMCQTKAANDAVLASLKAVYAAGPGLTQRTGPTPL